MANLSSWNPHVETFVDSSRPSNQQDASLDVITALVKNDTLMIEELVREMEMYLTTSDNVLRARGILLLAELLTRLISKPLDNATIHSLIGFFTSRLADWQALRGALIGCLALVRRKSNVGMVLGSDARMLAKSYLQNLQVQSLAQHDRKLCFELLACLLDHYPDAMVTLGDDLVYGTCEAIDEEKDPRCLTLTFHLVEVLARLFPDPSGPIASYAGDLFDILGRYFPIYFTHPKNDELDIKRDDLSMALMLDSLKYLSNCVLHFGADRMAKHAEVIWSSLKDAIFTSSQDPLSSLASELLEDVRSQENEVAKEALICLQRLMFQLDNSSGNMFISLIIENEDLETIFRSVISDKSYKDISAENKQKLHAIGSILSVSAKVSSACCNRVLQKNFPRLMDVLGISSRPSMDCSSNGNDVLPKRLNIGALYLCVELLTACRDLAVSSEEVSLQSPSRKDTWFVLLQNFSAPLAGAFGSILATTKSLDAEQADVYCAVKGLQLLAMFPGSFMPLSKTIYENVLMIFVSIVTGRFEEKFLWKLTLKALKKIGTSIGKFHESEKGTSYVNIVIENIVSLLSRDYCDVFLTLKLEAICDIGTAGLHFMLKVVRGLEEAISANFVEASVEGNLKSTEILVLLLESYSSRVLPWFEKHGDFEGVAMRFALKIFDQLDNSLTFNIGNNGQVLLDATMKAMRLAVGGCMQENQGLIVQRAYNILSLRTFSSLKESKLLSSVKLEGSELTHELISLSCRDEWLISLFAAVLTALRPQTPLPEVRVIVKFFMIFVLVKGHVPAAQALGSIINKWNIKANTTEVSSSCSFEEALDAILEMGPRNVLDNGPLRKCDGVYASMDIPCNLCAIVGSNSLVQTHAIVGLAWIGKGLVMRGHEKVKEITKLLLKCLLLSRKTDTVSLQKDTLEDNDGQDTHPLFARSAADAFHVLLSDSEVCLNKKFHATIRPLYKQHFFSSMMPIMLSLIKESDSAFTRAMLYRAFGHIISETPLSVLVTAAKKIIPSLLNGIAMLSLDVVNKDLTYSLLLVLSGILMDENGKEAILENANTIIAHLIGLVSYPHMMLVRETAIQCLVAMSGLPHVTIYPMRPQVLQALSKALDDPKRPVRQEAARCRQAWASTASRSLHF
ncbi:MMS19 nucleotide excision repair protein homolog isoform X3 [Magnolia sinica]|uniref:MMS19 nucleotide excision repair protein homolog isoform X3 n=1 Tax=Magnolia sinica TaxID=86752 RepID=UPI00265983FA|nr:MMS19 nucleotide excision repair protein homolog isoform X3 [Magnolia sinica]